jgi:SsrA-binding protein
MVKDSDDAEFDASRTSFTGVRVTARSTRRSLRLMSGTKLIASNRKARHDYTILDVYEAGIMLQGSEVKSLREGHVQLVDAYARLVNGEVWLEGVHIAPYQFAHGVGAHDPARPRKLLLNRDEIERLSARVGQERLALVPLSLYFKDGRAKVELALAQGRTKGDKRQALAKKDAQREIDREMGRQRKGKD